MPIPRTLLRDSVIHNSVRDRDTNNKPILNGKYSLDFVSIAGSKGYTSKASGDFTKQYSYKMIYDMVNSTGMVHPFKEGDIIVYNGKEYIVDKLSIIMARSSVIHHYILYLV